MGGIIDKVERQIIGKKKRTIRKVTPTHSERTVSIGNSSSDKEDIETLEAECQTSTRENSYVKIEFSKSNEDVTSESGNCKESKIQDTKGDIQEADMKLSKSSIDIHTEDKYLLPSSRYVLLDGNIHEPPERDNDPGLRTGNSESEFCFKKHLHSDTRPSSVQRGRTNKVLYQNHQRSGLWEKRNDNDTKLYRNNKCRCCSNYYCKTIVEDGAHNKRKETCCNPRFIYSKQERNDVSDYEDNNPLYVQSEKLGNYKNVNAKYCERRRRRDSDIFLDFNCQNSKQYKDLIEELGTSIAQRNKQRVQKALREFEIRSRENRNLDEPILYNDLDDSSHSSCNCSSNRRCHYSNRRNSMNFDFIHQPSISNNRIRNEKFNTIPMENNFKYGGSICTKAHKQKCASHWELDPKTGTWYKVCNYLTPNKNRIGFCSSIENLRRINSQTKLESISSDTRGSFSLYHKTRPCSQQSAICNKCGSHFRRF
ncbi:uncharacterized protein LOC108735108 [Agrilus planipennis]|uniref:Uncharacterized protein LOC108735108 n=1 Tax=Agrilus planipennis TaxID=224129 RepID=A0A7F5RCP7_AGRPL|nr:uncharacterized protein LOC108735108 [Agrilus planipennis]